MSINEDQTTKIKEITKKYILHCPFQSIQYKINEARCTIPLRLRRGESWLCDYFPKNEFNCPIFLATLKKELNP